MKIFVLIDVYLPGFKSGGPVRSIANLVEHMPPRFDFWIYTKDRDVEDRHPYPGVAVDAWNQVGRAHVFYASPSGIGIRPLSAAIREANPDIVYSNSLFGRMNIRYMVARRLGWVPPVPFVLAPRGELSPGALALKRYKKAPFLAFARRAGLFRNLTWQASTDLEKREIAAGLGAGSLERDQSRIAVSPNIVVAGDVISHKKTPPAHASKRSGSARFVFLSRLTRKKNLDFAVRMLGTVRGSVTLDVVGPLEDMAYWREIQKLLPALPAGVEVRAVGAVPHEQIGAVLQTYDFLVFPTHGENFGHVIHEALSQGCPAILSDTTPWRGLEKLQAGWDLSLDDEAAWRAVLQKCVDMSDEEYRIWSAGARQFAFEAYPIEKLIMENEHLFDGALRQ